MRIQTTSGGGFDRIRIWCTSSQCAFMWTQPIRIGCAFNAHQGAHVKAPWTEQVVSSQYCPKVQQRAHAGPWKISGIGLKLTTPEILVMSVRTMTYCHLVRQSACMKHQRLMHSLEYKYICIILRGRHQTRRPWYKSVVSQEATGPTMISGVEGSDIDRVGSSVRST